MEQKTEERDWLSIPEAAEHLEISEPTLYRWMKDGRVTFYKVGDSTRFTKEGLDKIARKYTGTEEATYYGTRCVACGHSGLIPGQVVSTGKVYFQPKKTKFFTVLQSYVTLDARACPRCGFIQLFTDAAKLNKLLPKRKSD